MTRLIGFARVELHPGDQARVSFEVSADLAAFTGRAGERIVEPGAIELRLGTSSADTHAALAVDLRGPERVVGFERTMTTPARVSLGDRISTRK